MRQVTAHSPYNIETCLIDLENIRNYYKVDHWIIGGHSWGADLALIYASEYTPHVAGLICRTISRLRVPALFVYGDKDIRPSWPFEQLANLLPNAHFESIEGAEHVFWFSHPNELKSILRDFVDDIIRNELL